MKYLSGDSQLINWLRVMRVSQGFFFISAMPVFLGTVLLYKYHHITINPVVFLLMMIGSVVYHLGADMINEYYDHLSGNDALVDLKTPFSGGTGILEKGLLEPKKVLRASLLFFAIGLGISFLIAYLTNPKVLIFSFLGLISCWGYSAPPLKFCYRGFGELVIFLNNGLFIIGAIFMAFTGEFDLRIILPSTFLGFLGFAIILMNEVPDFRADKQVNKRNLVVRLGIERAMVLHKIVIFLAYMSIILAVIFQHLPVCGLMALLGIFVVSDKEIFYKKLGEKAEDVKVLTGLCKSTIELKFKSWLFLMAGLGLDYLVKFFLS